MSEQPDSEASSSEKTSKNQTKEIDVAVPTKGGGDVIEESLNSLAKSIFSSKLEMGTLRVNESPSSNESEEVISRVAEMHDWDLDYKKRDQRLAPARIDLINRCEHNWILFLDDDCRIFPDYLSTLSEWLSCKRVGAVRGRKLQHEELHPTDWLRSRVRRAGVHALLVRREGLDNYQVPEDLYGIFEDEFMRRYMEEHYRFVYEPDAIFDHANQHRHPVGWKEGYLAGKYGYAPFHEYALNVPYSFVVPRNPLPHMKRALGWLAGRYGVMEGDR